MTPRALGLSLEARKLWIDFHDEIERDMSGDGRFAELQDVGSKGAEQAARIAGVLAMVDDPRADVVSADAMARGCKLMRWHLAGALRLAAEYLIPQDAADAQAILNWVHARGLRIVDAATLQKSGPGPVRHKERFDPAIKALVAAGWFNPDPTAARKTRRWIVAQAGEKP